MQHIEIFLFFLRQFAVMFVRVCGTGKGVTSEPIPLFYENIISEHRYSCGFRIPKKTSPFSQEVEDYL